MSGQLSSFDIASLDVSRGPIKKKQLSSIKNEPGGPDVRNVARRPYVASSWVVRLSLRVQRHGGWEFSVFIQILNSVTINLSFMENPSSLKFLQRTLNKLYL